MKQFYNVLGIAGMIILLPFIYAANKILDLKSTEPPEEPELRHTKKTTVYPDGIYPDCTANDFNKWSEYIHRQLN